MKSFTRKEEIIKVAAALFREKGYNAVTMRDIAAAMDIKAASLYNHINGKQEILENVIMQVANEFTEAVESVFIKRKEDGCVIDDLRTIIRKHIDITLKYSHALPSLTQDWMHLKEPVKAKFLMMRENYENRFRELIRIGMWQGEIKRIHPEVVLFSILSTLQTLYLWQEKRGRLEENVLKNDMTDVLIQGIIQLPPYLE
ncbi:TetR/AcrR family transcriptional regulator [Aequorivita sp. H23M31]|uniref:TetR/AcrR family transcriptional regulator n=1 Tax=Aequorivita ciconiae TaxID=2494375 RepID=A0A410G333_9FLAO|nr:TetR/AcrR family transcriptional regulator [Aequorivita sp. H23M31]QAA81698.1 TetR/AcrR family transcriptional regulator [Aequorivita sp. H23M31]